MSNSDINPSSSGVVLGDTDRVPQPSELTLADVLAGPSKIQVTDLIDPKAKRPSRSPVVAEAVRQLVGEEELAEDAPIVVGESSGVVRYRGDKPVQDIAGTAKSLAPGAAAGAGLGASISVLMDAASKKGLNVKRALLAAFVGAPTGAIVQLAARRAAQGYRDSKASPSIRSSRQLAATRGYIERPKV